MKGEFHNSERSEGVPLPHPHPHPLAALLGPGKVKLGRAKVWHQRSKRHLFPLLSTESTRSFCQSRKRLKVTAQAFTPSCQRDGRLSLSRRNTDLDEFGSVALERNSGAVVNHAPIKILYFDSK